MCQFTLQFSYSELQLKIFLSDVIIKMSMLKGQ
jgi:hypothetical protein